jgi:branched-chain amino acid transport system permease protein
MNKPAQFVKLVIGTVLILLLFSIPLFTKGAYLLHILIVAGINIILAISLRTIATTGQMSLAHAGFMAIGAYTSALLVMKLGLSFWVALPLGGIASALIALVVGYPFVRVKRVYFAMLTLFLGAVIRLIIMEWRNLTHGTSGLLNIPPPNSLSFFGLFHIVFDSKVPYYYLILVLVLISLFFLYRIDSSRVGRTLLAIQQDDSVAESVGINVTNFKVLAWCVGCFFAGITGAFYAHFIKTLTPDSFGVLQAIYVVVYMVVGGRRRFYGAILGAFILTLLPEFLRILKEYQPFVFVGILLIITFFLPGGLVDLPKLGVSLIRRHRTARISHA